MPPPALGEHTDAILAEAGLTAGEIAELRGAGIV
jgi:crotonobetainyl-CoA:carnitine CoA-transferase CaiB-like acyl-CoA transferase